MYVPRRHAQQSSSAATAAVVATTPPARATTLLCHASLPSGGGGLALVFSPHWCGASHSPPATALSLHQSGVCVSVARCVWRRRHTQMVLRPDRAVPAPDGEPRGRLEIVLATAAVGRKDPGRDVGGRLVALRASQKRRKFCASFGDDPVGTGDTCLLHVGPIVLDLHSELLRSALCQILRTTGEGSAAFSCRKHWVDNASSYR